MYLVRPWYVLERLGKLDLNAQLDGALLAVDDHSNRQCVLLHRFMDLHNFLDVGTRRLQIVHEVQNLNIISTNSFQNLDEGVDHQNEREGENAS